MAPNMPRTASPVILAALTIRRFNQAASERIQRPIERANSDFPAVCKSGRTNCFKWLNQSPASWTTPGFTPLRLVGAGSLPEYVGCMPVQRLEAWCEPIVVRHVDLVARHAVVTLSVFEFVMQSGTDL